MEKYPLESLLSVRHYREEEASRAVRDAETRCREARQRIADLQNELKAFRIWRREEENRRYDAIMGTAMSCEELEKFKAGLAALAEREAKKQEEVMLAEKELEKTEAQLEQARNHARLAQKETAKIQAHKDIWSQDAKKEAERQEDLELEEFRPISRKEAEAEGEDL